MKKNIKARITLHRETLLTLAASEMEAAQGAATYIKTVCLVSVGGSCIATCLSNCVVTTYC
jgi:hypothetical protein